jgi:hypothetical protein
MRSKRSFIALIVVVAIAGLVLAACGENDGTQAQESPTPSPTPTETTHTEDEWTIVTPVGWARADATSTTDAKKAVRYEGPDDEYVIVALDPLGSDFIADTVWRYEVKSDRFEIAEKQDCTGTREQGCSSDDARFDGYLLSKSTGEPEKVGGHVWYFIFGNTKSATVDVALFEQIIESILVTS